MTFPFPFFAPSIRYVELYNNTLVGLQSGADATTYTFNNVQLGTTSSDRLVLIGTELIDNNGGNIVSGVTINGTAATKVVSVAHGTKDSYIWQLDVPTGTTATVVVTADPNANGMGIMVASLYGVNHTVYDTATNTSGTSTIDAKSGGIVIGYGGVSAGDWVGLTEQFENNIDGSQYHTGALKFFDADTTGYSVSRTDLGSDDGFVLVSYQPSV